MTQKKEEQKPAEQASQDKKQQPAQDQPIVMQAAKGTRPLKAVMLSLNAPRIEPEEE